MVWITKNGKRINVDYRVVDGKRYRVTKHKGMRNKKNRKQFIRYGASSVFINDGRKHPNRGKPFSG